MAFLLQARLENPQSSEVIALTTAKRFAGFAAAALVSILALALFVAFPVRPVIATLELNETVPALMTTTTPARAGPVVKSTGNDGDYYPEHLTNGNAVAGMNLLDIVEMLCDWKAAGECHADGSMAQSLEINQKRYGISGQLHQILRNTARAMGWLKD